MVYNSRLKSIGPELVIFSTFLDLSLVRLILGLLDQSCVAFIYFFIFVSDFLLYVLRMHSQYCEIHDSLDTLFEVIVDPIPLIPLVFPGSYSYLLN